MKVNKFIILIIRS